MTEFNKEQQQAIDVRGINTLVSAGAGSGKTTVLSTRVIHLLKEGYDISRILILTFTKNAAENMRSRIRRQIEKEPSLDSQKKFVSGADIMTFDAFNQKIAQKYDFYLGLEGHYSIVDEAIMAVVKRNYLGRRFEEDIKNQNSDLLFLLERFADKNDRAIIEWVISIVDKIDISANPDRVLQALRQQPLPVDSGKIYDSIYARIKQNFTDFVEAEKTLLSGPYDSYCLYLDELAKKYTSYASFDDFKKGFAGFKFKPTRFKDDEDTKKQFAEIKSIYFEPIKDMSTLILQSDFERIYSSGESVHRYIYALVADLRAFIDEYKTENRVFSFTDIAHKVLNLLKTHPEIRSELKDHYREIMVDEYQDNSDIQEEMIDLLDNDNLFLVGDIKQSIYRFRNANPKLFIKRCEEYRTGEKRGIVIDMNCNYRSSPAVVHDVNSIFQAVMSRDFGGADYDEKQAMIAANPLYKDGDCSDEFMELEKDDRDQMEIEISAVAADIKKKMRTQNLHFGDFAIILDRSIAFTDIIKVLTDNGIPVAVNYNGSMLSEKFSKLLIDLLIVLKGCETASFATPEFKHAYVALARSYFFAEKDHDIYRKMKNHTYLDTPWLKDLQKICHLLKGRPVEEIYLAVLDRLAIASQIIKDENYRDNMIVLEMFKAHLHQLNHLHYSFTQIVDYFQTLDINELAPKGQFIGANKNAVTLINIHMAKGLEYSHCYFPQLFKTYFERSYSLALQFSLDFGLIMKLTSKDFPTVEKFREKNFVNPLQYIYSEQELNESRQERIRLLYVALTRAKRSFTLVTCSPAKMITSIADARCFGSVLQFSKILPKLKKSQLETVDEDDRPKLATPKIDYGFQYRSLTLSEKETGSKIFCASKTTTTQSAENLIFGTQMHEVLEAMNFKNPDFSAIKNSRMETAVRHLMQQEFMKNIDEAEIYQEYAFVDKKNQTTGIIDLLLIYEDHISIVDYKLKHIDDPAYLIQLGIYRDYIRQISPLPVSTYLYSVLEAKLVKI